MTAVRFHRTTRNQKLAPIERVPYDHAHFTYRPVPRAPFCASTYVSIEATCSEDCPFKRAEDGTPNGCYVDADSFMHRAMLTLDEGARGKSGREVILEEVAEIDRVWPNGIPQDGARGGRDLRLHIGGDVPDEASARALAGAAARWIARGGGRVWTYTHSWRTIPARAWWPISVVASVETPDDADRARARGYTPAAVVTDFPDGKRQFQFGAGSLLPCPAETLGKTCVACRVCLDGTDTGIAFKVHGRDAQTVREQLVQLGRKRRAA
jgi:hypothetical protein